MTKRNSVLAFTLLSTVAVYGGGGDEEQQVKIYYQGQDGAIYEKVLTQAEVEKLREAQQNQNSGGSSGGGSSMMDSIIGSAIGSTAGSYLGNKLANSSDDSYERRRPSYGSGGYVPPQTYSTGTQSRSSVTTTTPPTSTSQPKANIVSRGGSFSGMGLGG